MIRCHKRFPADGPYVRFCPTCAVTPGPADPPAEEIDERTRQVIEDGFVGLGNSGIPHLDWERLRVAENGAGELIANGPRGSGALSGEELEPAAQEERAARKRDQVRASYRRNGQKYAAANKARRRDWRRILADASGEKAAGEETAEDAEEER